MQAKRTYQKPMVHRFGSFRELTQAGCAGAGDGFMFQGGVAVGSTPTFSGTNPVTTDYCYVAPDSRG